MLRESRRRTAKEIILYFRFSPCVPHGLICTRTQFHTLSAVDKAQHGGIRPQRGLYVGPVHGRKSNFSVDNEVHLYSRAG